VVLGYGLCRFPEAGIQERFTQYYAVLEPFWECNRGHLESAFGGVDFAPFTVRETAKLDVESTMTLAALIGYLQTWSAYRTMRAGDPTAPDPLEDFRKDVHALLTTESASDAAGAGGEGSGAELNVTLRTMFFAIFLERAATANGEA
jgi:hypothetical protein